MSMAKKLATLRTMTDADLIAAHDKLSESTVVGIDYFLEELYRRELERSGKRMLYCTYAITAMTVVTTVATVVSVWLLVRGH